MGIAEGRFLQPEGATLLMHIGILRMEDGDLTGALGEFAEAQQIFSKLGVESFEAACLLALAVCASYREIFIRRSNITRSKPYFHHEIQIVGYTRGARGFSRLAIMQKEFARIHWI